MPDNDKNDKIYAIWIEISETDLNGENYKRIEVDLEPSAIFDNEEKAVKFAKDLHESVKRLIVLNREEG